MPGRQVELVVHDDDGGRVLDPEARGQAAHGETGLVHVGRRDGERHPVAGHGGHGHPRGHAFLGPQRHPMALGQQVHRVRPRVVQAAVELGARVAQPDDQQVGRGAPALGPGEGFAQGLALFGRGLGGLAASACLGGGALAGHGLALGALAFLLGRHDPRRLADGDGGLGVDVGGDPAGQGHVGHPDGVADGQRAHVDLERRRDGGRAPR